VSLRQICFSFIGYQMDRRPSSGTLAEDIVNAVVAEGAEAALLCPLDRYDISLSRWFSALSKKKESDSFSYGRPGRYRAL